jgi:hypothetical protein
VAARATPWRKARAAFGLSFAVHSFNQVTPGARRQDCWLHPVKPSWLSMMASISAKTSSAV